MPKELQAVQAESEFEVVVTLAATKDQKRFCEFTAKYWGGEATLVTVEKTVVGGLLALAG